jgi:hypothetical protein
LPDPRQLAVEAETDSLLGEQMKDLRELGCDAVGKVAETLQYAVGEADAVDLLSQWEGFGRFCRDRLGVEAVTLAVAFGVGSSDPMADVRQEYSGVTFDPARADDWANRWARGWERRFGG